MSNKLLKRSSYLANTSTSSSSVGATARYGLWPVEQYLNTSTTLLIKICNFDI
jgi:hypothetical protein